MGASETATVALQRTHTVGVNETITVGAAQEITVGGVQAVTVGANQTINVGANQSTERGRTRPGRRRINRSVGGNDASRDHRRRATQTRKVGDGAHHQCRQGRRADGRQESVIDAGDSITIKTGNASITMKKDGTIMIKGKDITIEGSGQDQRRRRRAKS